MKPSWTFTRGLLLGATLMFFLDPSTGGRRRALVRDRGGRAWRRSSRYLSRASGDLRNRVPALQGRISRAQAEAGLQSLPRPLQLLAAAAGAVAVAYGTRRAMDRGRTGESEPSLAPNYAYLR